MALDDAGKRAKSSVNYSKGGDACDFCTHFSENEGSGEPETGTCELVAGPIREDYWCRLFKRTAESSRPQ